MPYEKQATQQSPALILYLIDLSASMSLPLGDKTRLEVVEQALQAAINQMLMRSWRGNTAIPRYRVGMLGYSDKVYDLLDGIQTIDKVEIPKLEHLADTDTARAFLQAERILKREWPSLRQCPAPVICHLTDGEYTGDDPEPIARRIQEMALPDGNVLVENIFISDTILTHPVEDPRRWPGIRPDTRLASDYAKKLRQISSVLPETYRSQLLYAGYSLSAGALMLLPGTHPDLVALGFQMSAATRI